ncbi:DNA-binding response regulator [Pseudomonas sp. YJ42]|uniref:response regulator transcription factor n=1 Tax=Pseudomonas sp. YJ42 TaxID=3392115 RepID=UPI0039A36827
MVDLQKTGLPQQGAPHVLVIDDTPNELRGLLTLLRAQAWKVSVATEAYQGYQRALATRPDLIVLDVRMPQMNGFSLCRLLREASVTRRVPILFLTSSGSLEERLEGLTLGGVDYVLKCCEPEEVLARIRIHLQLTWRDEPCAAPFHETTDGDQPDQVILRAAMRLVEERLDDLPSLSVISRMVGTHEKRLSMIFREHLGTTVFGYIREARLRRGQKLLTDGSMSIQDIAELVGFRSACNFTTAFRQWLGITPTQFRQQIHGICEADSVRSA